jgi:hypothetical protein
MNELQCDKLWATIKRLARRKGPKRAAVAYVSNDDNLQFGDGDVLVTDGSDRMIGRRKRGQRELPFPTVGVNRGLNSSADREPPRR